ncbi:hypothetical protein FHL15_006494 [Xylaria flabelliformis]|uniref:Amidoligase enzyme n=1 Tax=Xylaria flabelliformis TaxID=2512241 RepID=A0A553HXA1_9PEZI|nr:hypothetical protein FHL15_006494 [Xylaria flabelliformis]
MADKSRQTLGIELEFIVFYTTPDQPAPAKDDKRYGPVLECPHYSKIPLPPGFEEDEYDYPRRKLEATWVRQKVADVIASAGFKSKASLYAKGPEADLFTLWNVVPDISVRLPFDFDQAYMPLEHVGVEVNSPVFVAGEDAFKEISTVVKAINSAFLTTVPPVCGFHVHVGRGHKPLEFRPVQRIASLLWLAENLIDTVHPGCRRGNKHCFGMRHFSNLGAALCTEHAGEHIDMLGKSRHAELSLDRVDKNRKKPTNYKYNRPLNVTDSQESTLSRSFACEYLVSFWEPLYNGLSAGVKMMDGVRMIFNSKDIEEIAHLTSFEEDRRGAYNFANLGSEQSANSPRKPTIEFRGAAGSLDADWIVVWAKICLALCGPAVVESSDDDFYQLLYDCEQGYYAPHKYDVFDLLHDLGICKEDINAVHGRLVSGRYEQEPGLAFHRPDDTLDCALDEGFEPGWQRRGRDDVYGTWPEHDDLPSPSWDDNDNSDDGSNGDSSQSVETYESSVNSVVDGFCSLSVQEDNWSTEPQQVVEWEPMLDTQGSTIW